MYYNRVTTTLNFKKIDFNRVFLLGQSYGAGVVKKMYLEFKKILPPKGVVLLSSLGGGLELIDVPIHILVGEEDDPQKTNVKNTIKEYQRTDVSYTLIPHSDHMLCDIEKGLRDG